jgi:hypothetical protein
MILDTISNFYLGQTAYMAWKEYSKAKKVHIPTKLSSLDFLNELIQGEIAFVSSGAGRLQNIFEIRV